MTLGIVESRWTRHYQFSLFLVLCIARSVFAQPLGSDASLYPATPAVQLSSLITRAFESNPDIRAAHAQWAQTVERYPQETALEDPMLSFSYYAENVETRVGPQKYSVGVSQNFPFPGTLRQKGRVIEKDIKIAEIQYERVVRDVIADLKSAAYEYVYLDGAAEITRRNRSLLQETLSYAQTKYSGQEAGLNEVFKAESQLAQLDYDLITLRELKTVQLAVLNAILNRPSDEAIGSVSAPLSMEGNLSLDALDDLVQQQRQEILLTQLGVEKAEEQIRLAHRLNLPNFKIGVNYIETGDAINPSTPDSGQDPIIVSGGISVPLWANKNKAQVRYAEEGLEAAEQRGDSIRNRTCVELRKAYFQLENARRLVELYRDHLLPQAEKSMAIAEEWNRERRGSVTEILETQSVWLNFNLAWLRARVDYAKALTELERIAGGSLQPAMRKDSES